MKINKNYSSSIALLALSLCIQNYGAAQDHSWWSRLMPSSETLTGMSWAAPAAVAAQRFLASESKLPQYSYVIPGALGTVAGTFANSNQGWGQAFLTSVMNQSPSFVLAALLWAGEKWGSRGAQTSEAPNGADQITENYQKFQELPGLLKKYQDRMSRLLEQFNDVLYKRSDVVELSQEAKNEHTQLTALHTKIRNANDSLEHARQGGLLPVDVTFPLFKRQYNFIADNIVLTPAQEIYADYIAYLMLSDENMINQIAISDFMDTNEILALKNEIIQRYVTDHLIRSLGDIISNDSQFANDFKHLLNNPDNLLLKTIATFAESHKIRLSTGRSKKELANKRFEKLLHTYEQQIAHFIDALFSDTTDDLDLPYQEILNTYRSLQKIYNWLSLQERGVESDLQLEPYDYIYAAVAARVIKPTTKVVFTENTQASISWVSGLMSNTAIGDAIAKSPDLLRAIETANEKRDMQQNARLINKVIELINKLREQAQPKVEAVD